MVVLFQGSMLTLRMFKMTMPSLCFNSFVVMQVGISLINTESLDNWLLEKQIPSNTEKLNQGNYSASQFNIKKITFPYFRFINVLFTNSAEFPLEGLHNPDILLGQFQLLGRTQEARLELSPLIALITIYKISCLFIFVNSNLKLGLLCLMLC